ncbi:uncharacterized protein BN624_00568 [Clostridium sp. CAG:356]|jgi:transcriptional regulator, tetR|nr:MAG: hypothetical protein BHW02_06755 [Clostridium sp. 28_12]CDD36765.1 uncharacterized protein BN624_00568 [Clostridium sp. CAG:356]
MPKETFLKLSKEKQQKVINAAKKEFARAPIENVSIKNIVEEADIARGSFYQYFESKEDLLIYILRENSEKLNTKLKDKVKETNGDIFKLYIFLYDSMIEEFTNNPDQELFKQIFINLKSSDENVFDLVRKTKPQDIIEYYEQIDKNNLKIENHEDLVIICDMLNVITRRALIKNFKNKSKEDCRKMFLKEIEYLKYGIEKKEEKDA